MPMTPFDAVLILGKELRRDPDRARRELRARAAAGAAAWRAGAPFVATLEARLRGQELSGSAIVADYLAELGVPQRAIVRMDRTRSTREEAVEGAALFVARGVRRGLVVTASYHVPRARRLFADVGAPAAVHAPEGLWRFANATERAWIEAGTPDAAVMAEECRIEAVLSNLARGLALLPVPARSRVEIVAGAWFRGVADALG
ncbi:MAG: YdcF family protein [Pseudomonadota bacterium]|nr:YdcF family protein [Pseudomonadota bacterium]